MVGPIGQANIHTHVHNADTLVRGSLKLAPMSAAAVNTSRCHRLGIDREELVVVVTRFVSALK